MQKIIPFLWFDNQAEQAAKFYISLFKDSKILNTTHYDKASAKVSGQPEGSVMTVSFQLAGQEFGALNGGPVFKFTPALSFFVSCRTREEIDELWQKLSIGGKALMQLDKYPFSERYGFLTDRYGVSWQFSLAESRQKIRVSMIFIGKLRGKAEEAIKLYTSLFRDSKIARIERFAPGEAKSGAVVKYSEFTLDGQVFTAMESDMEHKFTFTPAISLMVNCETQEEVDRLWDKLTEGGEEVQCGWLTDRYGVSWQIVPTILNKLLAGPDPAKSQRVMKAMLQMKKLDIEKLKNA